VAGGVSKRPREPGNGGGLKVRFRLKRTVLGLAFRSTVDAGADIDMFCTNAWG